MAFVQVQSGGGDNPLMVSSMTPGVVPGRVDSASAPPSSSRGNYLPMQSQASYHSATSSPSARRPSSGSDVDNEEVDVRANVAVADGHADIRASMTTMPTTVLSMTLSAKSSALHPGSQLLSTLISLLALSTSTFSSHILLLSAPAISDAATARVHSGNATAGSQLCLAPMQCLCDNSKLSNCTVPHTQK